MPGPATGERHRPAQQPAARTIITYATADHDAADACDPPAGRRQALGGDRNRHDRHHAQIIMPAASATAIRFLQHAPHRMASHAAAMPHRPPRAADARRSPRAGSTSAGSPSIRRIAGRLRPIQPRRPRTAWRVSAGSRSGASSARRGRKHERADCHPYGEIPGAHPGDARRAAWYRHSTGASTAASSSPSSRPTCRRTPRTCGWRPIRTAAAMPPTSSSRRTRVRAHRGHRRVLRHGRQRHGEHGRERHREGPRVAPQAASSPARPSPARSAACVLVMTAPPRAVFPRARAIDTGTSPQPVEPRA